MGNGLALWINTLVFFTRIDTFDLENFYAFGGGLIDLSFQPHEVFIFVAQFVFQFSLRHSQ